MKKIKNLIEEVFPFLLLTLYITLAVYSFLDSGYHGYSELQEIGQFLTFFIFFILVIVLFFLINKTHSKKLKLKKTLFRNTIQKGDSVNPQNFKKVSQFAISKQLSHKETPTNEVKLAQIAAEIELAKIKAEFELAKIKAKIKLAEISNENISNYIAYLPEDVFVIRKHDFIKKHLPLTNVSRQIEFLKLIESIYNKQKLLI